MSYLKMNAIIFIIIFTFVGCKNKEEERPMQAAQEKQEKQENIKTDSIRDKDRDLSTSKNKSLSDVIINSNKNIEEIGVEKKERKKKRHMEEKKEAAPPSDNMQNEKHAIIRVHYATNRARSSNARPSKYFGINRGKLTYGTCDVSIPILEHETGVLEAPSIFKFEFKENPDKHVVLINVTPRNYNSYMNGLKMEIAESTKKSAFIFVHGYNVSFADAARRTAQIKYDLGFDGAPIFFSWPSKAKTVAYPSDETDVEWAQSDLKKFLQDTAEKTNCENIYLIAHSMGNRALTGAYISLIREKPELKKRFREVILAAPDIDSDVFKRDIAPALAASSKRTTLYASSEDLALKASKTFHGYPRAGDTGTNLVIVKGIQTIDASNVDTGLLGHSYFADNKSVISDMFYLIRDGKEPVDRFGLKTINTSFGNYWIFKK